MGSDPLPFSDLEAQWPIYLRELFAALVAVETWARENTQLIDNTTAASALRKSYCPDREFTGRLVTLDERLSRMSCRIFPVIVASEANVADSATRPEKGVLIEKGRAEASIGLARERMEVIRTHNLEQGRKRGRAD